MSTSVTFRLRGIQLRENHRVAVVGSSPSLGSWVPKKTCFLAQSAHDTHQLRTTLDGLTAEYKYVIVQGSEIQWEGGENRIVDITKDDKECNDTWISVGASEFVARTDTGDFPEDVDTEVHEGGGVVHEGLSIAQKAAAEAHEGSLLRGKETSEAEIDEHTPSGEGLSPEEDQKRVLRQSDPNSEQHLDPDSGDTKEPFVETHAQRSPFLLIDRIFKLCRRRTTNAN